MFDEVLTDRTQYPDDTKVTLANGKETTVGEMRNKLGLKSEFHAHTTKIADEKRQLESKYQQDMQAAAQAIQQAQQASTRATGTPDNFEAYLSDQTFGPMAKRIQALDAQMAKIGAIEQRMQQHEQAFLTDKYSQVLTKLKQADPNLNQQELAQFAQAKGIYNLDDAYSLYTEKSRMEKAVKDAEAKGYERAKKEPPVPPMPRGGVAKPPADAPKNLNEAFEKLKQDPQLTQLFHGGEA